MPDHSTDRSHRLLEQFQSFEKPLFCYWIISSKRAQIEIVRSEVMRRTGSRTADFSGLQRRLDHAGDVDRHLILKIENVFQGAVETIGPEMGAGLGLDQLRGDARPVPTLAHRALQHIADTELASHLLHPDRSSLVSGARIAGDDEQPADAAERGDDLL